MNTRFISTCWTIRIPNCLLYFVFHTHFFLSIFPWLKSDINEQFFVGYQDLLSFSKKAWSFCFCHLYVLLKRKSNFVREQPGSTLSTTINGPRSFYITVNSFAFLSAEATLATTKLILDYLQKCKPHGQTTRKRNMFPLQKKIAGLAHRRSLRTFKIAFVERFQSLFVQGKFNRTLCIQTKHVPNEINRAIVILTIRGNFATHRNCSQQIHTCLNYNIGSCRDVEFPDG